MGLFAPNINVTPQLLVDSSILDDTCPETAGDKKIREIRLSV